MFSYQPPLMYINTAIRWKRCFELACTIKETSCLGFANPDRYAQMHYRYCGKSGLQLPALSLGLWHSFGHGHALESQRALLRNAFDLGITHFDLANNYGPPAGSAEENFGRLLREDFASYRDELIISTKAGYDMWPGALRLRRLAQISARQP